MSLPPFGCIMCGKPVPNPPLKSATGWGAMLCAEHFKATEPDTESRYVDADGIPHSGGSVCNGEPDATP